jgi:hypothetical protein
MNSMNDLETPAERELARRLEQVAGTTTVSPDAWDRIAARTVESPTSGPSSSASVRARSTGFVHRHSRSLLATAAAIAVQIGRAVVHGADRDDGGDNLRTTDHSERTTTTDREPSSERRSPSTTGSTSTTTVPGGAGPAGSTGGSAPGSETGGTPGAGGATPGAATPGPGSGGGGESGESSRAAPTRAAPTMTLRSSEYTVEIVATPGFHMSFRRTDDVGNNPGGPDGYGSATESGWTPTSNPRCLMSSGGQYPFPDAGLHAFTYGLVGSGIARIEIVMPGGQRVAARIGPAVESGYRAWLVERPPGNTQGIEGLDGAGNVVASIGPTYASGDDFAYSQATC